MTNRNYSPQAQHSPLAAQLRDELQQVQQLRRSLEEQLAAGGSQQAAHSHSRISQAQTELRSRDGQGAILDRRKVVQYACLKLLSCRQTGFYCDCCLERM